VPTTDAAPPSGEPLATRQGEAASAPLINWAAITQLAGPPGSATAESVAFVFQLFEQGLPPQIDALVAALASANAAQVRLEAHRLHGGCLQIGALALAERSRQIELLADTDSQVEQQAAQLRACYAQTLAALREYYAAPQP
jgi:HPt (histidine-containing phosphotransfer) domain-containing protein